MKRFKHIISVIRLKVEIKLNLFPFFLFITETNSETKDQFLCAVALVIEECFILMGIVRFEWNSPEKVRIWRIKSPRYDNQNHDLILKKGSQKL
jgi:hypothetical protein